MAGRTPYPQEMKERAVRMVGEIRGNYENEYAADALCVRSNGQQRQMHAQTPNPRPHVARRVATEG